MAWLEAPVPTERSHVQLEVDEEPPVPDEPSAAVPFAAWSNGSDATAAVDPRVAPGVTTIWWTNRWD